MKANELRIGNYYKPDALDEPHFKAITAKDIVELNDDPLDDYYQPIPITEEWLLKFGFKQIKPNHYWFKDKNSLRFSLIDNNLHCSIGDDECGFLYKMIKYVHQLQNLYYALTNQELTI